MLNRVIDAMVAGAVERALSRAIDRAAEDRGALRWDPPPPPLPMIPPLDMDRLAALAMGAGLRHMLDPTRWFDICAFDAACHAGGIIPRRGLRELLHPLHCVHWRNMDPELRGQVYAAIRETFMPAVVKAGLEKGGG